MWKKSDFEFHETFQPQMEYVSEILQLGARNYSGTKFEISELTGIPTGESKGKVVPHIKYAAYMGLIHYDQKNGAFSLNATEMGQEVFKQDPYLLEPVTKWLCHSCLCAKKGGAPNWEYLFQRLPLVYDEEFSLLYASEKQAAEFGFTVDRKKIFSVVKNTYSAGCFQQLRLMSEATGDKIVIFSQHFKPALLFVYAYSMATAWNMFFQGKNEIAVNEFLDQTGWDRLFSFEHDQVMFVMDELESAGIVNLNRQLSPATIIRTFSIDEIIGNIYSNVV